MKKTRAPKTRAEIYSLISNLPPDGLAPEQIAKKLKGSHKLILDEDAADLFEIGLLRLISDALRSRKAKIPTIQLELFDEYGVGKTFVIRKATPKGIRNIYKDISNMTVGEAEIYLEQHQRPRMSRNQEIVELARLVSDLKKDGALPDDNLIEAWERHRSPG